MSFFPLVRQTLRGLGRAPSFSLVALLTLALGTGASTAVFSVLQTLFLKPLPYADPGRLVHLYTADPNKHFPGARHLPLSAACLRDIQARQQVFSAVGASQPMGFTLTGAGGDPEWLKGLRVNAAFFQVLGVKPLLGRTLQPADDQDRGAVLLSHHMWQQRWGSDPAMVGRSVTLNGKSYHVVGILPPTFSWEREPRLFVADPPRPDEILGARGTLAFHGIARLKPGVSEGQARMAMDRLGQHLQAEFVDAKEWGIGTVGLWEHFYGQRRSTALFLGLTGLFVLIIASANLAGLVLARATARQRELSIRRALGGGWRSAFLPLFSEGLVLALGGSVLGLAVAVGLSALLRPYVPPERLGVYGLDLGVLGFAVMVALLATLVASLVPPLLFSRQPLAMTLRQGDRGNAGNTGWSRNLLVGSQVALTLTLLVSFGALWRSLRNLNQAPLGYQVDQALAFTVRPDDKRHPSPEGFLKQVVQHLATLPGVKVVGATSDTPLGGGANGDVIVQGRERENFAAHYRVASPDAFAALGIPLLKGRSFQESDCTALPTTVIVSRAMANRCWPGVDPLGKILLKHVTEGGPSPFTVVGVVEDVRHQGPGVDRDLDTLYWPGYGAFSGDTVSIVVRAAGNPMSLVPGIREMMKSLDPDMPLAKLQSLKADLDKHLEASRSQTTLLGLLAAIALAMAAAGIYGVMAQAVTQRTREIGIRKALGGQNTQVVWEIARRGMALAAAGLGLGALLTLLSSRVLSSQVYGISVHDPLSLALAALTLGLVALAAALIPATKAASVEPVIALRAE